MSAADALELLSWMRASSIEVWIDGGWGVDAALGEQTRPHKDLDIVIEERHLPALRALFEGRGFRERPDTPSNFVLANDAGLELDVHAMHFDATGHGIYSMGDGGVWVFPARGFAGRGTIEGQAVRCLTPEIQVLCHGQGYVPVEKDFQDMERLQERFGVSLPPGLQRGNQLRMALAPLQPADEAEARALIETGLGERFGGVDSDANPELRSLLRSFERGYFAIARVEGRLVATGGYLPVAPDTVQLQRMSVAQEFRRRGYGGAILDALLRTARARGYARAVLETTATWEDAIAFYDAAGFERTEIRDGDQWFSRSLAP